MTMADWIKKLDVFMTLNERDILNHAGKISHDMAKDWAESEYEKFKLNRIRLHDQEDSDFDRVMKQKTRKRRIKLISPLPIRLDSLLLASIRAIEIVLPRTNTKLIGLFLECTSSITFGHKKGLRKNLRPFLFIWSWRWESNPRPADYKFEGPLFSAD